MIVFDILRRTFEYLGYKVTFVSNFTDVDDKIIKAAKEEGLKYAYIVRSLAGKASRIYRVDLDGKETQVRFGDVSGLTLINLKRMLNISSKENVSNYILNGQLLSSLIYPSSILVENIEINKSDVKKDKEQVLTFPLQR